jgi:hypothetical protein
MSYLGPEAGYIIITFTSVPFGAFLLSTKTKLLVFISSFSTRPGKRWPHRLLPALSPYEPMAHQYSQIPSYKAPKKKQERIYIYHVTFSYLRKALYFNYLAKSPGIQVSRK